MAVVWSMTDSNLIELLLHIFVSLQYSTLLLAQKLIYRLYTFLSLFLLQELLPTEHTSFLKNWDLVEQLPLFIQLAFYYQFGQLFFTHIFKHDIEMQSQSST